MNRLRHRDSTVIDSVHSQEVVQVLIRLRCLSSLRLTHQFPLPVVPSVGTLSAHVLFMFMTPS